MLSNNSSAVGGRRGGLLLLALAAAVAGVIVLVVALTGQQSAPEPPATAAGPLDSSPSTSPDSSGGPTSPASPEESPSPEPSSSPAASDSEAPVGFSKPVSISIPAIDVQSEVFSIGKNPDGSLKVPRGPNVDKTAWYKNSATPGQVGPSIIEGHVDSVKGPSVFFNLGDLRPGDEITVTRADGKKAVYTVEGLKSFAKSEFPTELVYGGEINDATLRLITCSNFDESQGTHTGNLIVFSELTKVVPA